MSRDVHQSYNSFANEFSTALHTENNFSEHFHRNYEIIIVASGNCTCEINDKTYTLSKGDAAFVCPLLPHNFYLSEGSSVRRLNFNDAIILTFERAISGRTPQNPVFKIEEPTFSYVMETLNSTFGTESRAVFRINPPHTRMKIKGLLYILCSEITRATTFTESRKVDALAIEITEYIATHFTEDISLRDVATAKGYNYQYLSRLFNRTLNTNFKKVLNLYRLQQAYNILVDTDLPISTVAFESGFQSIRAFNQVCQDVYKMTPKQLRALRETP